MKLFPIIGLSVCLASSLAHAQAPGARLPDTLKKMDATSVRFKSAQADFHKVLTATFLGNKEETLQDGSLYVEGKGTQSQMGLLISGKGARKLEYRNGNLRLFNPGLGCYNNVASKAGQAESFLSVGFGGSGADLQKEWQVEDLGPETITSEGKPVEVEKLGLVPKSQTVKNNFAKVTLWMDLTRGIALKQVLTSPEGDVTTAVYSNIRLNTSINKKPYAFDDKVCK